MTDNNKTRKPTRLEGIIICADDAWSGGNGVDAHFCDILEKEGLCTKESAEDYYADEIEDDPEFTWEYDFICSFTESGRNFLKGIREGISSGQIEEPDPDYIS